MCTGQLVIAGRVDSITLYLVTFSFVNSGALLFNIDM